MSRPRGVPFQAGRSGNPGGRPKTAELRRLVWPFVPEAVAGLVEISRLPKTPQFIVAIRQAYDSLIDLGCPGARKGDPDGADSVNVLHLHLLAVKAANGDPGPTGPVPGGPGGLPAIPGPPELVELDEAGPAAEPELPGLEQMPTPRNVIPLPRFRAAPDSDESPPDEPPDEPSPDGPDAAA